MKKTKQTLAAIMMRLIIFTFFAVLTSTSAYGQECAPGCPVNWVGETFCYPDCNVSACSFVGGDCDGISFCAPSCPNIWLGDGFCDPDCLADCGSDGGDCIDDCLDVDADNVCDILDNCPSVCNSQQLDADNDTIGDVCDTNAGCGGVVCGVPQPACEESCGGCGSQKIR